MEEKTEKKTPEQRSAEQERLKQQIRFIVEIDKVKNIFRQTYLADGKRKENDAEHSWHLALSAVLLKEHMEEDVDLTRVMIMVLIHDLVEIDAGDTYASGCFRRIRADISENYGTSSRSMRARTRSLPICWIISSRCS